MNDLVTIATFDFLPDAHIALGRLITDGFDATLADQHLVQTDWLYAIAVGGIKLQLPRDQAEEASILLATVDPAWERSGEPSESAEGTPQIPGDGLAPQPLS